MDKGAARLICSLALVLVLGACSEPTLETPGPIESIQPSTTTTEVVVVPELSPAFVAYISPLDGADLSLGWTTFEKPLIEENMRGLGSCLESEGFGQVAAAFRESEPVAPSAQWLFPDLDQLQVRGFEAIPGDVGFNLLGDLSPGETITDPDHTMVDSLARHPELGIAATPEAANELNASLWSCVQATPMQETFEKGQQLAASWRSELFDIDDTPSVAALIDDLVECVRTIDPKFAEVVDINDWWATQFGQQINLHTDPDMSQGEFESEMRRWGQGYADCVLPLVEARRSLRLEARNRLVGGPPAYLIEFQAELMEALGP